MEHFLYEVLEVRNPWSFFDIEDRGWWAGNNDGSQFFKLCIRRVLKVINAIETPSFLQVFIRLGAAHVISSGHRFIDVVHMLASICLQHSNIRVKSQLTDIKWQGFIEESFSDKVGTRTENLKVEWAQVLTSELLLNQGGKRDPLKRDVLQLCAVKLLTQYNVNRFNLEIYDRQEDS